MEARRTHLVLVGGGHSHVLALKAIAKSCIYPNAVKVTLVSDQPKAYYSGMLPGSYISLSTGHIAGMYPAEEIEIDIQALCQWARAEFILAAATSMNPSSCTLSLADGRELCYDIISFDVGSTVRGSDVPGYEHVIPTRPLSRLLADLTKAADLAPGSDRAPRILVVGGGVAGVELAFSLKVRLPASQLTVADSRPLSAFMEERGAWARSNVLERLHQLNMRLLSNTVCQGIELAGTPTGEEADNNGPSDGQAKKVHFSSNQSEEFDAVVWATGAASHPFQQQLGLDLSPAGFILVRDTLQALRYDNVFAVGDCNCIQSQPNTPKAGVYAVREAPTLLANITALVQASPLETYTPQSGFLSLAISGLHEAISSWKGTSFRSYWMWRLKDRLDRGFMSLFTPEALGPQPPAFVP